MCSGLLLFVDRVSCKRMMLTMAASCVLIRLDYFKLYADKKTTCQPQTVLNSFYPVTGFLLPFHCIKSD